MKNEQGVTFVETLVAAGIFAIAVTGLSVSLVELGKSRQKVNAANAAVALQSYLASSLTDVDSYPTDVATRNTIASGTSGALVFTLNYTDFNGTATAVTLSGGIAPVPYSAYFTRDLVPCAPDFSNADCVVLARIDFTTEAVSGALNVQTGAAVTRYEWRAAYHVSTNPTADVGIGYFGANLNPPATAAFALADYKISLSDLANKFSGGADSNVAQCDMATEVAVRGMDRDSGQIWCIQRPNPAETCPGGRLPRKMILDTATNRLRLDCMNGTGAEYVEPRTFTCPNDYTLQSGLTGRMFFRWNVADTVVPPECVLRSATTEDFNYNLFSGYSGEPNLNTNDGAVTAANAAQINYQFCPRPPSGARYQHNLNAAPIGYSVVNITALDGICCAVAGCGVPSIVVPGSSAPDPTISSYTEPFTDSANIQLTTTWAPWPGTCRWPCAGAIPGRKSARIQVNKNLTCTATTITQPATPSPL